MRRVLVSWGGVIQTAGLMALIGPGLVVQGCERLTRPHAPHNAGAGAFFFTDRQQASGITFRHRIVHDAGKRYKAVHYDHGNGILAADVDGDGLIDLYFLNQIGPNALYKNLGHGRFRDVTRESGAAVGDRVCVGGAFADIDNDGDPDLYVTTVRTGNLLFENDGHGVFTDMTERSGLGYRGHSSGAVFFDHDRDGLLDLFVANVGHFTTDEYDPQGYYVGRERAFHLHLDRRFDEPSRLYKNLGHGRFQDVTEAVRLDAVGWNGDATAVDSNNDGYPALYITNMQGEDHLLENAGGTSFRDVTHAVFPKTSWGTMGVKFFDVDNDGLLDLMTTDMHSDMMGGISRADMKLPADQAPPVMGDISRAILGNALQKNLGGRYEEISDAIGAETFWPWGISVEDLDADGYLDMFVASGMGYPFPYGKNVLLMNDHGQRLVHAEEALGIEPRAPGVVISDYFALDCGGQDRERIECAPRFNMGSECLVNHVCSVGGLVSGTKSSRSSVIFDLDEDGDLDLVTTEFNDVPQVLISNLAQTRRIHFLKVSLTGTASNRNAIGARVMIWTGDGLQVRSVDGKSGHLSQSQLPLYFGLGERSSVDRIEVRWPSGIRQLIEGPIEANRLLTITEPGRVPAGARPEGMNQRSSLSDVVEAWTIWVPVGGEGGDEAVAPSWVSWWLF